MSNQVNITNMEINNVPKRIKYRRGTLSKDEPICIELCQYNEYQFKITNTLKNKYVKTEIFYLNNIEFEQDYYTERISIEFMR